MWIHVIGPCKCGAISVKVIPDLDRTDKSCPLGTFIVSSADKMTEVTVKLRANFT